MIVRWWFRGCAETKWSLAGGGMRGVGVFRLPSGTGAGGGSNSSASKTGEKMSSFKGHTKVISLILTILQFVSHNNNSHWLHFP